MLFAIGRDYSVRTTTSFGLAAGIVIVTMVSSRFLRRRKVEDETVAPPVAPTGMLDTLQAIGGPECPAFFREMAKRCDSLIFKLNVPPMMKMYAVGDYKAMREIYLECDKPSDIAYSGFNIISGVPGIFSRSSHDPKWKAIRKKCAPAFSSKEVSRMNNVCHDKLNEWIKTVLEPCVTSGGTFDPSHEMTKLTFSIIMESAFEYDDVTVAEYDMILRDLELSLSEFTFKCAVNPLRRFVVNFMPESRRALGAAYRLQAFSQKVLDLYRAKPNKAKENTLIKLIEGIPDFDDKQKIAEILTFIIAGHDTTGSSLGTAVYLAAKHPSETMKVRSSLTGSRSSSDYLQYFMRECNRLIPVGAGGSARLAHRDFVFATPKGPMKIPKGAFMLMPLTIPNNDTSVYEEPDEFRPERWANPTEPMNQSQFMFALGKRNCIGQSLATAELNSVIPELLSKYHFEIVEEGQLVYFLTLKFAGAQIKATKLVC